MPNPRRSTRHDLPTPSARATPRRLDRNPDLDPDDLRRTGSTGIMLLTIASVLVGIGVGFLIFPKVFYAKPAPPRVEKKEPSLKENEKDKHEADPENWRPDPAKLYPHANQLKAGKPPPVEKSEPAPAEEQSGPPAPEAAPAAPDEGIEKE